MTEPPASPGPGDPGRPGRPGRRDPRPVKELDAALAVELRRAKLQTWGATAAVGAVLVAAIVLFSVLIRDAQIRQRSSCAFFGDVAAAEIVSSTSKPSELGVSIVVDSRAAYLHDACGGPRLAPPSQALRRWAAFYHKRIPR